MSGCPFHQNKLREGLPPLTPRIAALPIDERGYPIPYFVGYIDGKPDFRLADTRKWYICHNDRMCWTCGQKLGTHATFVIGPMCSVTRTTAEPPSHLECAEWSVKGCPFLSRPGMVRREGGAKDPAEKAAGDMIERNPGVTALWTCRGWALNKRGYSVFRDQAGKPLIEVGNPVSVSWWREGREATRAEVQESIRTGLPLLEAACEMETLAHQRDEAHKMLREKLEIATRFFPAKSESRIIV